MKNYTHLTKEERIKMAFFLQEGKLKQYEIAIELNKHSSTISREIKRNKTINQRRFNNDQVAKKGLKNSAYFPDIAQKKYKKRRKESKQKLGLKSFELRDFVLKELKNHLSPILISGRAKFLNIGKISHEAIYQFIYAKENRFLELWKYLPRQHKKRRKKTGRKAGRRLIPNRIGIENRSEKINSRLEFGHWEADSIVGLRGTAAALHTKIERKNRLVRIKKIERKTAENTSLAMIDIWKNMPKKARISTTADNGSEFCRWEKVAKTLDMQVYFATSYHSWERGANERVNGLICRFFLKKTDFSKISEQQIQEVEDWINNRLMKCLDFKTPNEAFSLCFKHIALDG